MAILDKNGYQYTGYTEPFKLTKNVPSGTDLTAFDYDDLGAGIVAIENT